MRRVILGLILSGVSSGLWAAPPEKAGEKGSPSSPGGKRAGSTTLNFEEEDVGGKRRDPLGSIVNRSQADVKTNLIQLRTDWNEEINDSIHYIGGFTPLKIP